MILQLFDEDSSTYTYIVADVATREAVIIDPVLGQTARDLGELARHGLTLLWVLDTHVHADHETGANALKTKTGATSAVGAACESSGHDRMLVDGDRIAFGTSSLSVVATPGHTPGSMSFCFGSNVFTGDTLLIEGCGRTDFQNGSSDQLFASVTGKLFTLLPETIVWPGHDYRSRGSSTIGHERQHNPRFAGQDASGFRALMAGLNLTPPTHLDKAVPANRAGGALHAGQVPLPVIKPAQFSQRFDAAIDRLADLRDENESRRDPIEHAKPVAPADLEAMCHLAGDARILYLICRTGRRSLVATEALLNLRVTNVCSVTGGVLAMSPLQSPDASKAQSHV